jgi:hypothetical protein
MAQKISREKPPIKSPGKSEIEVTLRPIVLDILWVRVRTQLLLNIFLDHRFDYFKLVLMSEHRKSIIFSGDLELDVFCAQRSIGIAVGLGSNFRSSLVEH